jgi:hypothetical protein
VLTCCQGPAEGDGHLMGSCSEGARSRQGNAATPQPATSNHVL